MGRYRYTVWDPQRIILQMISQQCLYSFSLGTIVAIFTALFFSEPPHSTLAQIFTPQVRLFCDILSSFFNS